MDMSLSRYWLDGANVRENTEDYWKGKSHGGDLGYVGVPEVKNNKKVNKLEKEVKD